ncbi:MAG: class I SAM-dependent methyltransferase, partial [Sedimentisphaerales bacterium]
WAAKSHFLHHARTWPYGYVGDHKIIEDIYRHVSLSEGMGYLLDQCFLDTELGRAVPSRKDKMREIIEREITKKSNLKILNIGCGSCRELVELTPVIIKSAAQITCLDFDSAALDFSAERLGMLGLLSHINLRKYNALKMVNKERNQKEFGSQDLIYSIGLLDYMADDSLVRLIQAMYELLAPHGKVIAVFKDSTRYEVLSYHWLVDWDAFYQRNEAESKALIYRAGIAEENISVERDRTGIVIFYTIEKKGE